MKESWEIVQIIEDYLIANPSIRFGQALYNLGILDFTNTNEPEKEKHQLRDIYADSDIAILKRIKKNNGDTI